MDERHQEEGEDQTARGHDMHGAGVAVAGHDVMDVDQIALGQGQEIGQPVDLGRSALGPGCGAVRDTQGCPEESSQEDRRDDRAGDHQNARQRRSES